MSEVTIVRFVGELRHLYEEYGVDLKTVDKKPLMDDLAFFQKTHKPGSYRMHCVVIKHAFKLIGRKRLANYGTCVTSNPGYSVTERKGICEETAKVHLA